MDTPNVFPGRDGRPQPVQLRISASTTTGTAVVRLVGEIDQGQQKALEHALDRAVHTGPARLVIDMSGVSFCDTAGLSALLRTRLAAEAAKIDLVLAGPRPQTRRLLKLTETDGLFTTTNGSGFSR